MTQVKQTPFCFSDYFCYRSSHTIVSRSISGLRGSALSTEIHLSALSHLLVSVPFLILAQKSVQTQGKAD